MSETIYTEEEKQNTSTKFNEILETSTPNEEGDIESLDMLHKPTPPKALETSPATHFEFVEESSTEVVPLQRLKNSSVMEIYLKDKGLKPFLESITNHAQMLLETIENDTKTEGTIKDKVWDTAEGRKALTKISYRVTRTKTYLDKLGKDLTETWRQNKKLVDNNRSMAKDHLDALAYRIKAPIRKFEEAEQERLSRLQKLIRDEILIYDKTETLTSQQLTNNIEKLTKYEITEERFSDFYETTLEKKRALLNKLKVQLTISDQKEKEAAEFKLKKEELFKEQEKLRLDKENLLKIQKIADEADAKIKIEKEKLNQERLDHEKEHNETLAQIKLDQEKLTQERLEQEELVKQNLKQNDQNKTLSMCDNFKEIGGKATAPSVSSPNNLEETQNKIDEIDFKLMFENDDLLKYFNIEENLPVNYEKKLSTLTSHLLDLDLCNKLKNLLEEVYRLGKVKGIVKTRECLTDNINLQENLKNSIKKHDDLKIEHAKLTEEYWQFYNNPENSLKKYVALKEEYDLLRTEYDKIKERLFNRSCDMEKKNE